jgi:putative heme uptake system protein
MDATLLAGRRRVGRRVAPGRRATSYAPRVAQPGSAETFLLVDGENIDATLGGSLLGRRPAPEERPRWDRVRDHASGVWDQPVRGLFFLNGTDHVPMPFVQALAALQFRPVLLSGPSEVKVVDLAIQRTLEALAQRDGDVLLASHDGDFAPQLAALLEQGTRRVGVVGFRELISGALTELSAVGLEVHDLEDDVGAFTVALPRVRVIPIERFDPWTLLD